MADIKGSPAISKNNTWVQTERRAHESWSDLCIKSPRAAAMLHRLVSLMQPHGNVVVISMADLAEVMGCNVRTAYRAADDLIDGHWVQRIKVSGSVFGFVVNSEVAWSGFRAGRYDGAVFTASVVSSQAELDKPRVQLRKVPILFPPKEKALPQETGGDPGQTLLPGMEPSCEIRPEDIPQPNNPDYDPRQMTIDDYPPKESGHE